MRIGIVHVMLPYMVIPIYAVLLRIDPDLRRAAEGLGAPAWRAFARVTLPLSLRWRVRGLRARLRHHARRFITPALLGGGRVMMISMLIEQQVREFLDWNFAAALATVLLVVTLAGLRAELGRPTPGGTAPMASRQALAAVDPAPIGVIAELFILWPPLLVVCRFRCFSASDPPLPLGLLPGSGMSAS